MFFSRYIWFLTLFWLWLILKVTNSNALFFYNAYIYVTFILTTRLQSLQCQYIPISLFEWNFSLMMNFYLKLSQYLTIDYQLSKLLSFMLYVSLQNNKVSYTLLWSLLSLFLNIYYSLVFIYLSVIALANGRYQTLPSS